MEQKVEHRLRRRNSQTGRKKRRRLDWSRSQPRKGDYRLIVWCRACPDERELSFKTLVDEAHGEVPVASAVRLQQLWVAPD